MRLALEISVNGADYYAPMVRLRGMECNEVFPVQRKNSSAFRNRQLQYFVPIA